MSAKRIALMDKFDSSFTEGDNFVGYAFGFMNKGHDVFQLDPYSVDFDDSTAKVYRLSGNVKNISRSEGERVDIESFSAIMDLSDMIDYNFSEKFAKYNVLHVNNPLEMHASADKRTYAKRYSEFIPKTIVESDIGVLERVLIDEFDGKMVVKDPFGACGIGVEKISLADSDYMEKLQNMTDDGNNKVVAQKFMEFASEGSKRVALVGDVKSPDSYRIVHFYGRKPGNNSWKDNISQGGMIVDLDDIRDDEKELCLNVAKKSGLYTVGLDIMDDSNSDGKRVPRLVETNSVLAFNADGRYFEKLSKITDFISEELL